MCKTINGCAVGLLLFVSACSAPIPALDRPAPCSAEWFTFVEQELRTSDLEGHGPDIGSDEWRSVIEFKLGVRDQEGVPDAGTPEWCDFIDLRIASLTTFWNTGRMAQAQNSHPTQ